MRVPIPSHMTSFTLAKLLGVALLVAGQLAAQSDTASLFGTVRDSSSAVITGAKVQLKSVATGAVREQVTNEKGLYHLDRLAPGQYGISVEAPGFKQFKASSVQLQVAQISRLNVQMEVGEPSESIEVEGTVSPLNTESVANGTIIGDRKIVQLPLNGRQFIQMALLVPGASGGGRAVQQNQVRIGQLGGLSIAGGRTNNTAFLLDGAANVDPDFSSLNYSPQIDSVAEFQVQTAMVGAEYSRATINVVSKSGGNAFHGSAFEFLRNKAVDARPFNAPSDLPKFQRNQFGGTLGGPIRRNKAFTFLAYEGLAVRQAGAGLTTVTVPSALQREGDFSATRGGIFDPTTLAGGSRLQFPNNRIPANRLNPLSLAAVRAMPLPTNSATSTFENSGGVLRQDNHNYSVRGDYNLSSRWSLFSRYSGSDEDALIPAVVTGRDQVSDVRSQNAVVGSTFVINSKLVNETRVSFGRLRILTGLPELNFNIAG